jgi:predicted RNase H-like nuclease
MESYIGVDWASGRWVVVIANEEETTVRTEPSFLNIWHEYGKDPDVKSILVDVPIGLPEDGERVCDVEAKEVLGNRGSTVFSIPSREVVESRCYRDARESNNGSLGSQSWWLFPQMREVDVFLQEHKNAREKVYESHPELCFWKLSDDSTTSKLPEKGREERLQILGRD